MPKKRGLVGEAVLVLSDQIDYRRINQTRTAAVGSDSLLVEKLVVKVREKREAVPQKETMFGTSDRKKPRLRGETILKRVPGLPVNSLREQHLKQSRPGKHEMCIFRSLARKSGLFLYTI